MRVSGMMMNATQIFILAALSVMTASERLEAQQPETDVSNVLKTSLTLDSQTVTVSLTDDPDPTRQNLLASAMASSVRIGTLDAPRLLRVGTLDGYQAGSSQVLHYGLWLAHIDDVWKIEARYLPSDDAELLPHNALYTIPLAHARVVSATESLTVALIPSGERSGQLVLTWGRDQWSTDFTLASSSVVDRDPQEVERARLETSGIPSTDLEFDADQASTYRFYVLLEREETAVTLPGRGDVSLTFWRGVGSDGRDFESLTTISSGEVAKITAGAVMRLLTEVPLRFGETTLATGNYSPDTPGQYGLWLKRVGSGWQLVFNHEYDAWGTQYDPDFVAAVVDLDYSSDGSALRSLGAALIPTSSTSGYLAIHWGPHEWTAAFETAP